MRQFVQRIGIIVLVGLLSGCQALGLRDRQPALGELPLGDAPMQPTREMPAREAAQVCLATAKKMDEAGRETEAIALYLRAREHDPNCDVAARLAVLYDRQQLSNEALSEYRQALDKQPRNADLWNDLGYYHLRREQYTEAEKHFRRALELKPKHRQALNNLALNYGYQGRYEECYETFTQSLGAAAAHSNLGMILTQQAHWNEAAVEFRAALAEQPDLVPAQEMLTYLEDHSSPAAIAADQAP